MTDSRYSDGFERPQRPSADTHSSYEEAIRRSNERLNRAHRRLSYSSDTTQQARPSVASQRTASRQGAGRPRQTIRIDDYATRQDQWDGTYQQQPQRGTYQQPYAQRQPARQAPVAQPGRQRGVQLPNPLSRTGRTAPGAYHDQQMQGHSRASGGYQARPSTFSQKIPSIPLPQNGLLVRAVVCIVLLLIIVFSVTRIGPATAARNDAQASVQTQQEQLDTLNTQNADLQSQLDNMQSTIDKYNDLVAKSS